MYLLLNEFYYINFTYYKNVKLYLIENQILQFVSVKYTYLIFIYMQYDHHQNTTERALASEVSVANNLLKCKVLIGDKAGQIVFLNRITLYSDKEYPFTFKRSQFQVLLNISDFCRLQIIENKFCHIEKY